MTRLTEKDIVGLDQELTDYNQELIKKTGMSLHAVACLAAGINEDDFLRSVRGLKAAVVPVTSGLGIIGGFTGSVESIIRFLGCRTFVTEATDVDGLYEAVKREADIVFLADDQRFIALNLHNGNTAENGCATGRGFAAALVGSAGGLKAKEVLILGAGPVGMAAEEFLSEQGAKTAFYEVDSDKKTFLLEHGYKVEESLDHALSSYRYLVDATPEGFFIAQERLHDQVIIAAPGVPLGLTREAYQYHKERVVHDPLQIGVASMLALAAGSKLPKKDPCISVENSQKL